MPAEVVVAGSRWALLAAPAVALLWAGILIGVSFLATPIKFKAPSLTLPVALDVGRATFHLLMKVEWIAAALLIVVTGVARFTLWQFVPIAVIVACLIVQTFSLLPRLDARVATIIEGEPLPKSTLHLAYVACEITKLMLLLGSAIAAIGLW